MKKLFTLLCVVALTFTLAGCGSNQTQANNASTETNPVIQDIESQDKIAHNSLTGFATLSAAEAYANLEVNLPESFGTWKEESIYAMYEKQVEVLYLNESDGKTRVRYALQGDVLTSDLEGLEESTLAYDKANVSIKTKDDLIFEAKLDVENESLSLVSTTGVSSEELISLLDTVLETK